jgi:transcriptional regulator with XRE-family HTH domain
VGHESGKQFRFRLRRARERIGLSQEHLSALSAIHRSKLAKVELGLQEPRLSEALRIAEAIAGLGGETVVSLVLGADTGESSKQTLSMQTRTRRPDQPAAARDRSPNLADDAVDVATWVELSNVGDHTISLLTDAVHDLAERHASVPPRRMLADVLHRHWQIRTMLRGGRQRLRQTRELLGLESALLAHACILIGDLHDDEAAMLFGSTAALCAEEAGTCPATALSAQAKTERWRRRYRSSADIARRGFECSPPTPLRILLASQEANASALLGDHERARHALKRAEEAAETCSVGDSGISPWSCPEPRRALYALAVAIHMNEPEAGLESAQRADEGWSRGEPWVRGTWAQIRLGAAIAHLMAGE